MRIKLLMSIMLSISLLFLSCAEKHWEKFETRIKKMSDEELLDYYKTINLALEGAQYGEKPDPIVRDANKDDENPGSVSISNQYYDLDKKAKIARKEIRRRNLKIPIKNQFFIE